MGSKHQELGNRLLLAGRACQAGERHKAREQREQENHIRAAESPGRDMLGSPETVEGPDLELQKLGVYHREVVL